MRRRIWRISEDRFDDVTPQVDIAPSSINITGYEGQNIEGAFRIMSMNKTPMKGFVFSSSPYVVCDKPEFEGEDITVPFHTISEGFQDGDHLTGFFDIVYNMGEKRLPFNFSFEGIPLSSSEGSIKDLSDFARLCEVNFTEGMSVFYSKGFQHFMDGAGTKLRLLYKGYSEGVHSALNLENFLEEANLKEVLSFSLDRTEIDYNGIEADQKDSINITRTTWGRLLITAKADAGFVEIVKPTINEGDFLGREYRFEYYVRKEKLHSGKNEATITFSDGKSIKTATIRVMVPEENEAERKLRYRIGRLKCDIYQDIISYRVGKLELPVFAKKLYDNLIILYKASESQNKTYDPAVYFDNNGRIHENDSNMMEFKFDAARTTEERRDEEEYLTYRLPVLHRLMLCHSRILNKEKQKALWLIRDLKDDIINHNSFEWAYLLYLCIIIDSDEDYQNKLTDEIEKIFRLNPEDYRIFLFLLYLRKEYRTDPARKLKDIKQWIISGFNSPFLLAEAYDIYKSNPYLIQKMDDFTFKVLNFARKREVFTKDVVGQFANLLRSEEEYRSKVFTVIEAGYHAQPSTELLKAVIEYLIQNELFDEPASVWYRAGIDNSLSINGLYEAYLNALPMDKLADVPEQVLIYFRYPNNLPEDRKAFLFVTVISMKWKKPRIYNDYVPYMEEFALSQMQRERVDENLTVIYQEMISNNHNHPVFSELIGPFMYIKRVAVLRKDARQVVLYQNCYKKPVVAPVVRGIAYIPVVDKDYRIFLVDPDGSMTTAESEYAVDDILHFNDESEVSDEFKHSVPAMLYELTRHEDSYIYSEEEIPFIESILGNNDLDPVFMMGLYQGIYELLKRNGREDILSSYFWNKRDEFVIPTEIVPSVIGYGIRTEHFEEAYEYLLHSNGQGVGKGLLLYLLNYMIVKYEFNSNDFLISYCASLMMDNFASQQTVAYLGRYFTGPVDWMEKLLDNSERESVINTELAGRIIIQLLYANDDKHFPDKAFKTFLSRKPNRMVREAMLTYWSREYILKNANLPNIFFSELLRAYAYDDDVNESIRVALTKYLCLKDKLNDEENVILDRAIRFYMARNIRFSFFKDAPAWLKIKYHLYDKVYIEYRSASGKRLYICSKRKNEDSTIELLPEVYPGLYTRAFILFTGESLQYEIRMDKKDGEVIISEEATGPNYFEKENENRYELLNHMCYDGMLSEWEDLSNTIKEYGRQDMVTKELFGII